MKAIIRVTNAFRDTTHVTKVLPRSAGPGYLIGPEAKAQVFSAEEAIVTTDKLRSRQHYMELVKLGIAPQFEILQVDPTRAGIARTEGALDDHQFFEQEFIDELNRIAAEDVDSIRPSDRRLP